MYSTSRRSLRERVISDSSASNSLCSSTKRRTLLPGAMLAFTSPTAWRTSSPTSAFCERSAKVVKTIPSFSAQLPTLSKLMMISAVTYASAGPPTAITSRM